MFHDNKHTHRHMPGFSLIEMMAAVAILGFGIAGLAGGLSGSLEAWRRVEERSNAIELLRFKLAEHAATNQVIDGLSGSFEEPFERYTWRVQARATEFVGLYRLTVEVTWPGRKSLRTVRGETLVPQQ